MACKPRASPCPALFIRIFSSASTDSKMVARLAAVTLRPLSSMVIRAYVPSLVRVASCQGARDHFDFLNRW